MRRLAPYGVVLWTLAFLALGELGLEVRARLRGYETLLFGPPPTAVTTADSEFGRTPDFPFRSRVTRPERTPGVVRIWIGSASFAEDIFVPAAEIWPVRLQDELGRRGLAVEVLNASLGGVGVPHATRELRALGPVWRPDLALVYHLPNDVDRLAGELLGPRADPDGEGGFRTVGVAEGEGPTSGDGTEGDAGTPGDGGVAARPWPTRLALRTTTFEQAVNVLGTRVSAVRPRADEPPAGLFEAFDATVEGFLAAAREVGARPVVATVPMSHPDPAQPPPAEYERLLARSNDRLSTLGWQRAMAEGNEHLRRLAAERGVVLVDVAALAGGRTELFDDNFHYTDAGHAELARLVADALEPLVRALAPEAGR